MEFHFIFLLLIDGSSFFSLGVFQFSILSTIDNAPQEHLIENKGLSLLLGDSRYIGKKPVKNCLNARAKMTSDKFDDERSLARKTNENKMKNG